MTFANKRSARMKLKEIPPDLSLTGIEPGAGKMIAPHRYIGERFMRAGAGRFPINPAGSLAVQRRDELYNVAWVPEHA